ncbi:MAG: protein kinase [Oscillospiraceae bacterium]|jgi:hypothetical protein|nr:protein kinase [Oscillospiraceae bacterium]
MSKSNIKRTKKTFFFTKVILIGLSVLISASTMNVFVPFAKVVQIIEKNENKKNNKNFEKKLNFLHKTSRFIKKNPIKSMVMGVFATSGLKYVFDFLKSKKTPNPALKFSVPEVFEFSVPKTFEFSDSKVFEVPIPEVLPDFRKFDIFTNCLLDFKALSISKALPGMNQEELRSILKLIIKFLKNYIAGGINSKFDNIPFKPQFSKSIEAKSLISKIKKNIDDVNLNCEIVLNHLKEAIEIQKEVIEKEQIQKQNRVCKNHNFKFDKKKLNVMNLAIQLEKEEIILKKMLSNYSSPTFKAWDNRNERKLFLKLFGSEKEAKKEIFIHGKMEEFTSKVVKDIIKINVERSKNSEKVEVFIVVSEFLVGQNFLDYIESIQNKKNKDKIMLNFIYQVAKQLKTLHNLEHVYGDIKGENFMICEIKGPNNFKVKLIDFGGPKTHINKTYKTICPCVFEYLSPEYCKMLLNDRCQVKSSQDIWSLGCMLYNLLYNKSPFECEMLKLTKQEIRSLQAKHQEFAQINQFSTKNTPKNLDELIKFCLVIDPEKRATLKQLRNWSKNI